MLEIPLLLVVIIVVALIFDFTNGAHDCANAIATVVSTKVISPKVAVIMAAGLNLFGAFLGEEVAHTLGSGIVNTDMVMGCQALVLAALIGAIAWNLITWYFGIPSSSSHALIGGLMGAAVAYSGFGTLNGPSIAKKILLPLVLSPLAGFAVGFLFMSLLALGLWKVSRQRVSSTFHRLQILSAAFMATSHGLNDAQKTMGVITLALFIFHEIDTIHVPFWVKFICASAMAAGTALGGVEDRQDHGAPHLQTRTGARLRSGDLRRPRHHRCLGFRRAHKHHPYHHRLHLRCRFHQAPFGSALGYRRQPRGGMGAHHPRIRPHRRTQFLAARPHGIRAIEAADTTISEGPTMLAHRRPF